MYAGLGSDAANYLARVAEGVGFDLEIVENGPAKTDMLAQAEKCCDEHRMPGHGNEDNERAKLIRMIECWPE